jgi:hypothetical protein
MASRAGEAICSEFSMTQAEYGAAVRALSWHLFGFRAFVLSTVMAAGAGLLLLILGEDLPGFVFLGVAVVWTLFGGWAVAIAPLRRFRHQPEMHAPQRYCFSEDEVSLTFVSGASQIKWQYFVDLLETSGAYLLRHRTRRIANIILKRGFRSVEEERRFRELASSKLKWLGGRHGAGEGRSTPSSSKP